MFINYYEILGVAIDATEGQVKQAYRLNAIKYHPDKNPASKDIFTNVAEAYEILSDPKKRRVYDSKGYQASKESVQQNGQGDQDEMISF